MKSLYFFQNFQMFSKVPFFNSSDRVLSSKFEDVFTDFLAQSIG